MKTFSVVLLSVALLQSGGAKTGIGVPMTPDRINEAIAFGAAAREVRLYRLSSNMGRVTCGYSTPFLRVAMAAREAKKNYRPFTATDVTAAMSDPIVAVACPSTFVGGSGPDAKRVFANVENVVLTGKDGTGDAVQPTSKVPMPETYQNAFGAKVEASGILATFLIADFMRPGGEVHVIYDKQVKSGFGGCDDCAIEIKIGKEVR